MDTVSFQKKIAEFCQKRDWDQYHSPKELAIGLVTESSELLDQFRFLSEEQCLKKLESDQGREAIEDELSDVLFFLLRFGQMYSVDLGVALDRKIAKNAQKYPITESYGKNLKYNELPTAD